MRGVAAITAAVLLASTSAAAVAAVIDVHDGESINNAIKSAPSGSTIKVYPGTYGPVVFSKSGITIESVEPGKAHIKGGNSPAVSSYGKDNVGVIGFTLSSNVDGTKMGGSPSNHVSNITFTGNTLLTSGLDGFKFFQADKLTMTNNTIKNAGVKHNGNGDGGIDFVSIDNSLVQGNKIEKTFGHACLMLKGGSDHNKVTGNEFMGCERDGITVGGFTGAKFMASEDKGVEAYSNEISGNVIEAEGKCPFYFHKAENNKIENNKTIGGKGGCKSGGGSNGPNADVNVAGAGAGAGAGGDGGGPGGSTPSPLDANKISSSISTMRANGLNDSAIKYIFGLDGITVPDEVLNGTKTAQQAIEDGTMKQETPSTGWTPPTMKPTPEPDLTDKGSASTDWSPDTVLPTIESLRQTITSTTKPPNC